MDLNVAGLNKVTCISDSSHDGRVVTISDGVNTWSGAIAAISESDYGCVFMIPSMPAPAKKTYTVVLKNADEITVEYTRDIELGFGDSLIVGLYEDDEIVRVGSVPIATSTRVGGVKTAESTSNGIYLDNGAIKLQSASPTQKGGVAVPSGTYNGVYTSGGNLYTKNASTSQSGCVTIGTGINVSSGEISLKKADSSNLGGIKIGTGLAIDSYGTASVKPAGTGSSNNLGGVFVNSYSGLGVSSSGSLYVNSGRGLTINSSELLVKVAGKTSNDLGGVYVADDTGIKLTNDGRLWLWPKRTYCIATATEAASVSAQSTEKITVKCTNSSDVNKFYNDLALPVYAKLSDDSYDNLGGFVIGFSHLNENYTTFDINFQNIRSSSKSITTSTVFRVYYFYF